MRPAVSEAFSDCNRLGRSPFQNAAGIWQENSLGEPRQMALTRLYFNLGILREWHGGDTPKRRYERIYWARAERKAWRAPEAYPSFRVTRTYE